MDTAILVFYNLLTVTSTILLDVSWVFYIAVPFILFYIGIDIFQYSRQLKYKKAIDWCLIEVRIPRQIEKGPKAMENFFTALHGLRNAPSKFSELYLDGEVTRPFSFEMCAHKGSTRFFIRTPKGLKPAVASMIYAAYSDVEVTDTQDYIEEFPESFFDLQSLGYDIGGGEFALDKDSAYPVASYDVFESKDGDARIVDSMALLLELFGRLTLEETVWMQIVAAPEGEDWKKASEKIIQETKESEQKALKAAKEKGEAVVVTRTPGEEARLKLIEKKRTKNGFKCLIRYMYIAPKSSFNKDLSGRGIPTYFSQFVTDANKFKKNGGTALGSDWRDFPYFLHKRTVPERKAFFWRWYRKRALPEKTWSGKMFNSTLLYHGGFDMKTMILNSDELATIFHLPTNVVLTAPVVRRMESKTLPPPPVLPK